MRILIPSLTSQILLFEKPIKFFSSFTFSIYLFHQPFILFYAALLNLDPNGYTFYGFTIFLVFLSVFIIGYLIERRRYKLRNVLNDYLSTFAFLKQTKAPS
jgi:membrane-bound acyltransferase YfiQ involved in biofilm formation